MQAFLFIVKRNVWNFSWCIPAALFFVKKHEGAWTIPKGEIMSGEDPLLCAVREFEEETGYKVSGNFIPLTSITQKAGKVVHCWALHYELDASTIESNTFTIEWPPKSGKMKSFPEIDKAGWFEIDEAKKLINERQVDFITQAVAIIK